MSKYTHYIDATEHGNNLTGHDNNGNFWGNKTLFQMPELCTLETCDMTMSSFMYRPTVIGNSIYAGIFVLLIIGQLFLGIKHKTWGYMIAMILGMILEVLGYVGRVLMHNSPFNNNLFLISLVTLTIAPALLTAAIYLCLARIVHVYGAHLSFFKPRTYTLVFCGCDLISLVLQALGGALASMADTKDQSDLGKNIMLAGLGFQVFSLILFTICAGEFALRCWKNKRGWNVQYIDLLNSKLFKSFLVGLLVATVTIFARSVYRCAELSGGFDSHLFVDDELAFMILEGVMIVLACTCLTVLHPAVCFQGTWADANFNFRTKNGGSEKLMGRDSQDLELGSVGHLNQPTAYNRSM